MRTRIIVTLCWLFAVFCPGTIATSGNVSGGGARESAIAYLTEPTLIGSTIVQGPVLFTHDTVKMARGEPCTSVKTLEDAMEFRRPGRCKWAEPTIQQPWPMWLDAWSWPWSCRDEDGSHHLLLTVIDCLDCPRWELRDPTQSLPEAVAR